MRSKAPSPRPRNSQSGYAIVLVMFFLALLALTMAAAAPTVLSDVQREKEADMVWKGEQYARGVKLYYMKTHRFPPSLEDLTENKTGIRFMRKAYKDPMNNGDGSWRLIYIGPSGQLIGSLKNRTISFGGQVIQQQPNGPLSQSSFGSGSPFGSNSAGQQPGATGSTTGSSDSSNNSFGQPQPLGGMMDSSSVIGGNIIGVGSKVDKKSFLWYDKAKNYREFEFIWDPSKDLRMGGAAKGIGTPVQNLGSSGAPTVPSQNPNLNGSPDPMANPPLQAPQN